MLDSLTDRLQMFNKYMHINPDVESLVFQHHSSAMCIQNWLDTHFITFSKAWPLNYLVKIK